MTNAEKYLKDGVDIGRLAREITELSWSNDDCLEDNITLYFRQQATPTLTEDERVILRNIDRTEYYYIGRADDITDNLYLLNDRQGRVDIDMYNHLFQFIKERRRIFY